MRRAVLLAVVFLLGLSVGKVIEGLREGSSEAAAAGGAAGNGDTNGDGERDLSDAVYLLNWLFVGGPEPVAAGDDCPPRFVDNGDGTVTDRDTGFTWLARPLDADGDGSVSYSDAVSKESAYTLAANLVFAGHDDWILPLTCDAASLVTRPGEFPALDPVFGLESDMFWIASTNGGDPCHGATFALSASGFVELTSSAYVIALREPPGR